MKIIVFDTAVGTSNRGDDIIVSSAEIYLRPLLEQSFVMRFGTHVKNLGWAHCLTNSVKIKYAKEADYKFILGTNLLTSNAIRSMKQWPVLSLPDYLLYKNCILMGVGIKFKDTKLSLHTRLLYEKLLRKDIIHSVRDEQSKKLLSSISGLQVLNTGCPTLWSLTPELCEKIPTFKGPNVIATVSGYKSQQDAIKDQQMIAILEKNYEKIYLWVQTSEDEQYYKTLQHQKDVQRIYSFKQFKEVCQNGKVDYIGTRLHGGIYAMQCGVRTLIVEIDQRAEGFRLTNNINTIKRDKIQALEDVLHSQIKTEIRLKSAEIKEWLAQFHYNV